VLFNAGCFSALLLIVGCGDSRRDEATALIESTVPPGLTLESVDPRFVIKWLPDGTRMAEIPVYYRLSDNRYFVHRLLATPRGNLLAREIDDVATWATSELHPDDPIHEEIIRVRAGVSTDTLILDLVMTKGEQLATQLKIAWTPTPQIIEGLPELRGRELPDPGIGILAGSAAATAAYQSIRASIETMENLRAQWISTRDLRTENDRHRWVQSFVSGAVFVGDGRRLLVVRGCAPEFRPEWVLTSDGDSGKTLEMHATLEPVYAGGLILRVTKTSEIQTLTPGEITRQRSIPNVNAATLSLPDSRTLVLSTPNAERLTLKFDRVADMLPPEAD